MHPLSWPLAHPESWGAWAVCCLGLDLADAGSIPQAVRDRLRGTDLAMFHGAASEISAAAAMKRAGLGFAWYPPEGGDFVIENDPIRYVEVKHARFSSARADDEMKRLFALWSKVIGAFTDVRVSFYPLPSLLDALSPKKRTAFDWDGLALQFIRTLNDLRAEETLPARRVTPIGTIMMGKTDEELHQVGGGGFGGFFIDESHETDRVMRSAVNRAIRQLPPRQTSLIALDWAAATETFRTTVVRRLGDLGQADARVAGLLVRSVILGNTDPVPTSETTVIGHPAMSEVVQGSTVVRALLADRHAPLRSPS